MDTFEKAVILENEVEAQLVAGILTERRIPHLLRSYHDSVYDGVFQAQMGWGHIEAPRARHREIIAILEEVRRQGRHGAGAT